MVNTKKFSEFAAGSLTTSTKKMAGISNTSGGENIIMDFTIEWTVATRPSPPYNGLLGYNTDLAQYEYWDGGSWVQFESGGGSVTEIDTGLGLTGGPIFSTGTISFATIPANTFWGNITGGIALPTTVSTSYFVKVTDIGVTVEAWSAALDSIAGLTTVANELLYLTAPNTYSVISAAASSVLVTSSGSVPAFSTTLPFAVQLNITQLGTQSAALNMGNHLINNVTDPVSAQDAATRAYVLAQTTGLFLPLAGGTMSGIINMGNHKITNLTDPSSGQDAVTLAYLNSASGLGAYLPLSGGTMTGQINMSSNKIISLLDPTNPQDAATKNYVDTVATGLTVQVACYAATTGALNAIYANGASGIGATLINNGALAAFQTDGTTPSTNARILVWNQASSLENGIYTLTNTGSGAVAWILTRATDYDQPAEIQPGDLVIINNGTLYAGTSFIETASVAAVGTDPILFSQFTFSATAVLLKANNLSDVANKTISFNNISPLTTKGDLIGFDGSDNVRLGVGGTTGQILQANSGASAGLAWSTATYPSTTTANRIIYSSSTNTVDQITSVVGGVLVTDSSSVPSFLANPSATGKLLYSVNGQASAWTVPIYPIASGSAGKVIISDGTNNVYSTPTFPNSAAVVGTILRADGTNWLASTATFADTYGASTLLYANGANTVAGLATANSSVLVTTSTGVPVQSGTMTNGQLIIGSTGATPAVGSLTAGTGISITPGAGSISIAATGAVVTPAALSKGDDTNVTLTLTGTPSTALLQATTITAGWTGQLGLTRGGTAASLTASNGGIVYSTSSALAILSGTATAGQILRSGASAAPSWSTATYPATAGTSGNYLKSDGTNFVSTALTAPTIQKFTSGSGTYTTPAGVVYIRVVMVGGGGGGAGSGTGAGTAATDGGASTFGTTLLSAGGGVHGVINATGGAGGTSSLGSGPVGIALTGGMGAANGGVQAAAAGRSCGGKGGSSAFGGAGSSSGGSTAADGSAAATNTGGGGGGAGSYVDGVFSGSGGGSGGYVDAIITSPSASYSYAVGGAGSAGAAGTSGRAGGAGGSGLIIVYEYYQ